MTAVSPVGEADPRWTRIGRHAALGAVGVCAALFVVGILLWAREGHLVPALALLPDSWSEASLRRVTADLGIPALGVPAYLMLLELLAATAGITAAVLVLRGAPTGFRQYVAVAIALWVTMGGTLSVVYRQALDGPAAEIPALLQGLGWVSVFPLAYLFPDGKFMPPWSRWAALAWASYLAVLVVLVLLGYESDPQSLLETLPLLILFGTCVFAAVHRYRHVSTPEQRLQSRGVVAALAVWFVVVLLSVASPLRALLEQVNGAGLAANAVLLLCSYLVSVLLPASIAIAVLRYRLFEVNAWINRALVYAVLMSTVIGAYALLAGVAGLVWQENELAAPVVATVVIAVVFHPLRLRAQRWVNRFVYGWRREPYAALTDLGRQLETVVPPDQVLHTLVQQLGTTLKLGYVAAAHGSVTVSWPDAATAPSEGVEEFPLRWQDQDLGVLLVAPRVGEDLRAADRELLAGLARQAGAAVQAAVLNDDLRRSRERILVAREDERARLQRDLHDGLGPTLASLYQRVDAARSLLERNPATADRLLGEVAQQTHAAIGEIRSIVRFLRPPELDELGLAGAVEAVGARFAGLHVDVVATGLPRLEPVVESAAYRIAVEALTNAARHAGATSATVRLDLREGCLDVTVTDDGSGIAADAHKGTGLRYMRERADELGGSFAVGRSLAGGTWVHALLPVGQLT